MSKGKLTDKRTRFVEAYTGEAMGNATQAARLAGYQQPGQEGERLLRNADVASAVLKASKPVRAKAVATRGERQRLLSSIMRGEVGDIAFRPDGSSFERTKACDRLRATELLGKMQGDYIDRVKLGLDIPDDETGQRHALMLALKALGPGDE